MKILSTLSEIVNEVFLATDWKTAQTVFIEHVNQTNIKDKNKMINEVSKMTNLYKIQRYTANALLKYEGLGIKI
jgi:CRISPR/Cas system CSM-associated protein Csm3 (group 7 of RAMP superfamily)